MSGSQALNATHDDVRPHAQSAHSFVTTRRRPSGGVDTSKRRLALGSGLLVGLCLWCGVAQAQQETRVSVTDTLTTEYRADNKNGLDGLDDEYGIAVNRLNLSGRSGGISTQLRLDTVYFPNRNLGLGVRNPDFQNDVRLERLSVRYKLGDWTLVAGDFYIQLGRGIALALRKVDEAGLDVTLRGGKVRYSTDDHEIMVFAGETNTSNIDLLNQIFIEETRDVFTGFNYEYSGFDRLNGGFFGMYFEPRETLLPGERDRIFANGVYLEIPELTERAALYAEAGSQHQEIAGAVSTGRGFGNTILANAFAGYATLDVDLDPVTLLVEALFLDDYDLRGSTNTALGSRFIYNQAPTLERFDQQVLTNNDVRGGRVRAEYNFYEPDLVLHANLMVRLNQARAAEELRQYHAFGGFLLYYQDGASRIQLSGGHRDEQQTQGAFTKTLTHTEWDWLQAVGGGYSLHINGNVDWWELQDNPFIWSSTFFGVDKAGLGGLTFEFGVDTQNESPGVRNYFFAGILAAEISDAITARATAGSQRGGIKCVSGVCREFPAFAGGRLELVGRF